MKRKAATEDSFDLFLDTICNTFGGIIFLAILVAILIQTRGVLQSPEQDSRTNHSIKEIRDLTQQLASLNANVKNLKLNLNSLPEIEVSKELAEYERYTMAFANLEQQLDKTFQERGKQEQQLKQLITENTQLNAENQQIPTRLKDLQVRFESEQDKVTELVDSHEKVLRLPRESETKADSTLALLKGGLIFIAGEFDTGSKSFDGEGVSTKSLLAGYRVTPVAGRGVTAENEAFDEFVRSMQRYNQIITLAVWPDSFAKFPELKSKLVKAGVRYQIWIQGPGDDLMISIGNSSANRVQ